VTQAPKSVPRGAGRRADTGEDPGTPQPGRPRLVTAPVRDEAERADRHRLPFDPIKAAADEWARRWDEPHRMRAVTSLMRVHQLVLTELDELLRPLNLTFARYEVLVLLAFSRRGALPLGKIGERLQVHATSVTPLVKRLENSGFITRNRHPEDGRAVLAAITPSGREVLQRATDAIVEAKFALGAMSESECDQLTELLTSPRAAAGDF
jgi:DNA-binding MarR family transcriptional regulator